MTAPLARMSTVDALTAALRTRILDGDLAAGTRLIERELTETYGVARHSLRASLRDLAGEGLVELIPNRGAFVTAPNPNAIRDLFALRTALELEAAHLAEAKELKAELKTAAQRLRAVCGQPDPAWSAIVDGHAAFHRTIVACGRAPRIISAYDALDAEMRLFLIALRPVWTLARMAEHHDKLARELPRLGPPALRAHLEDGARSVLAE